MSYPGALPPPPGVTPNLDQPKPTLQKVWIAVLVIELVLPLLYILARIYVRRRVMREWSRADTTISIAFLLLVCLVGLDFSLLKYGVGKNAWNIPLETFSKFAEILNIQQIVYMPAICFTKMAILFQLLGIFVPSKSSGRWWVVWSFIVFNLIFFTLLFFIEIFQCIPREKIWNPTVQGRCIDIQKTFIATGTVNVVEDFGILIMSLYWIFKLQTSMPRRMRIAAVFAVGLFACCCSVLRLVESVLNVSNPDITVALVPVNLWATAEVSAGIVVACMPYIPKLFQKPGLRTLMQPSNDETKFRLQHNEGSDMTDTSTQVSALESAFHKDSISERSSVESPNAAGKRHIVKTFEVNQYSEPRNCDTHADRLQSVSGMLR